MSLVKFQIINNSWLPVWWGLKRLNLDQVQGQEQGQDLLFPKMKEILKLLHFYIRIYCCCSVCHTSVPLLFFFYPAKNKNISSNTLIYHQIVDDNLLFLFSEFEKDCTFPGRV